MAIANYYYERGSYLSTIRHCQNILYSYRGTQYLEPALALMARCYDDLGLPEAAAMPAAFRKLLSVLHLLRHQNNFAAGVSTFNLKVRQLRSFGIELEFFRYMYFQFS